METVCTAGITEDGRWVRLYPLPYLQLPKAKRFAKYQWIEADVRPHGSSNRDKRPESHNIDVATIQLKDKVDTKNFWQERKELILPLKRSSMEEIQAEYDQRKTSLAIFKPAEVTKLTIEAGDPDWTPKQKAKMAQTTIFGKAPMQLEKMPYTFYYHFRCNNESCRGHKMSIIDWELEELYRKAQNKFGKYAMDSILNYVKVNFFDKYWSPGYDSYLIVGSRFPYASFMVLGVFYPQKPNPKPH